MYSSYSSEEDNASSLSFLQGKIIFAVDLVDAIDLVDTVNWNNNDLIGYPLEMGPTIGRVLCYQAGTMVRALLLNEYNDDKYVQWDKTINSMLLLLLLKYKRSGLRFLCLNRVVMEQDRMHSFYLNQRLIDLDQCLNIFGFIGFQFPWFSWQTDNLGGCSETEPLESILMCYDLVFPV